MTQITSFNNNDKAAYCYIDIIIRNIPEKENIQNSLQILLGSENVFPGTFLIRLAVVCKYHAAIIQTYTEQDGRLIDSLARSTHSESQAAYNADLFAATNDIALMDDGNIQAAFNAQNCKCHNVFSVLLQNKST